MTGAAEPGDAAGAAVVSGDFDDDGYADLVLAAPDDGVGAIPGAGLLNVIYGDKEGLGESFEQLWHQNISGVKGVSEPGDGFGSSMAVGDFNDDGYQDLAIGVPGEDVGGIVDAGAVAVLYGGNNGLSTVDNLWHQGSPGVKGGPEAGDRFGGALVAGDFDRDGFTDLAIGIPGEDLEGRSAAGAVAVLYGRSSGLSATGDDLWHQGVSGVKGVIESGDGFGTALAAGDFDGDRYDDLAIGAPGESIGNVAEAGSTTVLYGAGGGLTPAGDQAWYQDSPGIWGRSELGDRFGAALAAGDFNHDGFSDLVIGSPGEAIGAAAEAGAANVLYGRSGGLSAIADQAWHQERTDFPGDSESGDGFGTSFQVGDYDGDGYHDLAVGVPGEDLSGRADAGLVNVIYGSISRLRTSGVEVIHQGTPGLAGTIEADDRFGELL